MCFLPHEDAVRRWLSANQEESSHQEMNLDLGCSASRNVRDKDLLFKSPSLWYVVRAATAD